MYVVKDQMFVFITSKVHFSALAITVGLSHTAPWKSIRCNLNAVIAYPCPLPRSLSQANKIFNSRVPFRLKFLRLKNQLLFVFNGNKMAIVQRTQIRALMPTLLSTEWSMNSVTRTIGFKCFQLTSTFKREMK